MNVKYSSLEGEDVTKSPYLNASTGYIVKILDDNFGVIKTGTSRVLFDTCDLWISQEATASRLNKSLPTVASIGNAVMFHAALVQPSADIPYLATAVWFASSSPFPEGKCPVSIKKEKIHPEKVRIYETVSQCKVLKKNVHGSSKVYDQKGVVKVAFKDQFGCKFSSAIVEFSKKNSDVKKYAFMLSTQCVETHEAKKVCVPGAKVCFSAVPVDTDTIADYVGTVVSQIHSRLPLVDNPEKVVEKSLSTLRSILKVNSSLCKSIKTKPIVVSLPSASYHVVDCFPTGRLVCMFNEKAGILEDHTRELAYFEISDVNLSSKLKLKDIVMVMTRCREVTIRYQASRVFAGPVKMIVHDGTVAVSSNINKYFPAIDVKRKKISPKSGSFHQDKISRAASAIELYKKDKILTPDYVMDSGEFDSSLNSEKSDADESVSAKADSQTSTVTSCSSPNVLIKMVGAVFNILNENFCLLKFRDDHDKISYCLFDTYDLYLENNKSAALSNISVQDVLTTDMEVFFHACELSPGSAVPWLATAVWLTTSSFSPDPVPRSRINREKIDVFLKVTESCKSMVNGNSDAVVDVDDQSECCMEESSIDAAPQNSKVVGVTIAENDEDGEVKDGPGNESASDEHGFDSRESLPKILSDDITTGTFLYEIDDNHAIFSLSYGKDLKALVNRSRVWVVDKPMIYPNWKLFSNKLPHNLRIKARRVDDSSTFQYQALFAHMEVPSYASDVGDFSYTPELAKFAEENQDVATLNKQLKQLEDVKPKQALTS